MNSISHQRAKPIQVLLVAVLAVMSVLRAADLTKPENARLLEQWGYLNVVAYGADPTGGRDPTREIQKAIDDGAAQGKAVLLPLGTYTISDTLVCYVQIRGGSDGLLMPLILVPIRFVHPNPHYFAWANRGQSAMSVWLPVVWRAPQ